MERIKARNRKGEEQRFISKKYYGEITQHTRILYLYTAYPPTPAAAKPRIMTHTKFQLTVVVFSLPAFFHITKSIAV